MKSNEKSQFTTISNIPIFKAIFPKFVLGERLNNEENTYILTVALLALKKYETDKSLVSYLEFSYYIILNYSLTNNDYKPLYDFSVEYGFFPIAKEILDKNLIEININDIFTKVGIESFNNSFYTETLQQYNIKKSISIDVKEMAYIAPTSFGKSEFIIEHIRLVKDYKKKLAIIVPSKSLLVQTYNLVKSNFKEFKIIYHNEMFNSEDNEFIAILTQERALKLLDEDKELFFDVIYIDEAHNILNRDIRNILLTRVLRLNFIRNTDTQTLYLSPLLENTTKLRLFDNQNIVTKKIDINIKHPIFILKNNDEESVYNRYSNQFYRVNIDDRDYLEYIKNTALKKNFIYLRNPRDIEQFAKELIDRLPDITLDDDLNKLITSLSSQIHSEYWMIKLIKKGIIYLHGKLPDILKEYLEFNFRNIQSLKYLIANHVVLEGVNLPIDNMYILHVYSLKSKDAMNLIGRINRLNYIFNGEGNNLNKLIPKVYFVENKYNSVDMVNYIKEKLRSNVFEDKINNPLLIEYENENAPQNIKSEDEQIRYIEDYILKDYDEEIDALLKTLYKNNIQQYIEINEYYLKLLKDRVQSIKNIDSNAIEVIDLIYNLFFDYEQISIKKDEMFYFGEFEFVRNGYKAFIHKSKTKTLKQYVISELRYYNSLLNKNIFIGKSFGNVNSSGQISPFYRDNKYVSIEGKSTSEIINLILVKYKLNHDFINYDLNNFVEVLYELEVLDEGRFNEYYYGSENENIINLQRLGVSRSLINRLIEDSKIDLITFDNKNNIIETEELKSYLESLNEIEKFELSKYL